MAVTVPPRARKKARVLNLVPPSRTPLDSNCTDVTNKLKHALLTAQSGATPGAMIIALDHEGEWSIELAGKLLKDDDTVRLISFHMFGACLYASQSLSVS